MRKFGYFMVGVVLLAALPIVSGHDDQPKPGQRTVSKLMRAKLEHAQKVLEGVTLNDFKMVRDHAEELILISKEAEWKTLKTEQYELYSNEFRRNADALITMSKDKNSDGAALAYVDLTLTCIKCHKHVREVRRTE